MAQNELKSLYSTRNSVRVKYFLHTHGQKVQEQHGIHESIPSIPNVNYCERRYFRAVHIFVLFAFIKYPKNMYIVKITCMMSHRGKNINIANINPREIANFRKCAKMYTRENIYVHSIFHWKNIKIANINPPEFANFRKCAKIYTRENIDVHSIFHWLALGPVWGSPGFAFGVPGFGLGPPSFWIQTCWYR